MLQFDNNQPLLFTKDLNLQSSCFEPSPDIDQYSILLLFVLTSTSNTMRIACVHMGLTIGTWEKVERVWTSPFLNSGVCSNV